MFCDLRDGRKLLDLLEGLTGTVLVSFCESSKTFCQHFWEWNHLTFKIPKIWSASVLIYLIDTCALQTVTEGLGTLSEFVFLWNLSCGKKTCLICECNRLPLQNIDFKDEPWHHQNTYRFLAMHIMKLQECSWRVTAVSPQANTNTCITSYEIYF